MFKVGDIVVCTFSKHTLPLRVEEVDGNLIKISWRGCFGELHISDDWVEARYLKLYTGRDKSFNLV